MKLGTESTNRKEILLAMALCFLQDVSNAKKCQSFSFVLIVVVSVQPPILKAYSYRYQT
jgi:hypothetical protein